MRLIFGDIASRLRTIAGLGSMIPIAAGGLAIGVATMNKRNGVNFFTDNWPKLVLTMGSVELNVSGAENLAVHRPAVFIFNHRNSFDVFVTAALVRENWTAVGRKELERDPIASEGTRTETATVGPLRTSTRTSKTSASRTSTR